jgi:hypothetical protein
MTRLGRRDLIATLFVLVATLSYVLWLQNGAATAVSSRVVGATIFGLGFAACVANAEGLMAVFGADPAQRRASTAYVVLASVLGTTALVFGIMAMVGGGETMLLALVASILGLWAVSTIRHMINSHVWARLHPRPA